MKTEEQAISGFHPDFIPQDHSPSRPYESTAPIRQRYSLKLGCLKREALSSIRLENHVFLLLNKRGHSDLDSSPNTPSLCPYTHCFTSVSPS